MRIQYKIKCLNDVKMTNSDEIAFMKDNVYVMTGLEYGYEDNHFSFEAANEIGHKCHIVLKAICNNKGEILKDIELGKWFKNHFEIIEKYTPETRKYICNCGFDLRDKGLSLNSDAILNFNEKTKKFYISSKTSDLVCGNCYGYVDIDNKELEIS